MTMLEIPKAMHRGESENPFVALGDGTHLQLLQVNVEAGLWVIRTRFEPGVVVPTHKHTGEVFAFTISGSWHYREYPEVNVAGSYLYEPAGSVHTLTVRPRTTVSPTCGSRSTAPTSTSMPTATWSRSWMPDSYAIPTSLSAMPAACPAPTSSARSAATTRRRGRGS